MSTEKTYLTRCPDCRKIHEISAIAHEQSYPRFGAATCPWCKLLYSPTGNIISYTPSEDAVGKIARARADIAAALEERRIVDTLISLGWTPPGENKLRKALDKITKLDPYTQNFGDAVQIAREALLDTLYEEFDKNLKPMLDAVPSLAEVTDCVFDNQHPVQPPAVAQESVIKEKQLEVVGRIANKLGVRTTDAYRIIAAYTEASAVEVNEKLTNDFVTQLDKLGHRNYILRMSNEKLLIALNAISDRASDLVNMNENRAASVASELGEMADAAIAAAEAAKGSWAMKPEDQAAFEAAFIRTFVHPENADQLTFRLGWEAALAHRDAQPAGAVNEQMYQALVKTKA